MCLAERRPPPRLEPGRAATDCRAGQRLLRLSRLRVGPEGRPAPRVGGAGPGRLEGGSLPPWEPDPQPGPRGGGKAAGAGDTDRPCTSPHFPLLGGTVSPPCSGPQAGPGLILGSAGSLDAAPSPAPDGRAELPSCTDRPGQARPRHRGPGRSRSLSRGRGAWRPGRRTGESLSPVSPACRPQSPGAASLTAESQPSLVPRTPGGEMWQNRSLATSGVPGLFTSPRGPWGSGVKVQTPPHCADMDTSLDDVSAQGPGVSGGRGVRAHRAAAGTGQAQRPGQSHGQRGLGL